MPDKKTLELQIKLQAKEAAEAVKSFRAEIKNMASQAKAAGETIASDTAVYKNLERSAKQAAASFKLFGSSSQELRDLQKQLKSAALELTDRGFAPESQEVQKLVAEYNKLGAASDKLEAQEGGFLGMLDKIKQELGSVAVAAAAVKFDSVLASGAKFALEQADAVRGMKEEFGIMLGDMKAGAAFFNELQKFNFWTPFDMETIAQGTKGLMAAKIPLGEMTEYLTRFGDLAQGNSQRFQSFINAFSKSSAKGKADMEVLNVFIDQGVQILDQLGKQMGVTSGEVVKMASEGKISFSDLTKALKDLTEEGGLYHDSMASASQRLSGAQAGLQESVNSLAASFGQMLAPAAQKIIELITSLVDAINNSPIAKGVLAGIVVALAVAINVKLVAAVISLAVKMWTAYAATMAQAGAMSILNPALLAGVAAVGLATAGLVAFAAHQQQAADKTNEAALAAIKQNEAIKELAETVKSFSEEQLYFNVSLMEDELRSLQDELAELEQKKRRIGNGDFSDISFSVRNIGAPVDSDVEEKIIAVKKKIDELTEAVRAYNNEASRRKMEALKEANEVLEHRNKLYNQTREAQREQILKELEFAKSLRTLKTVNEDGTESGFDSRKTEAIIKMLEQKLADLNRKAAETLGTEWSDKIGSNVQKTMREYEKAQEAMRKKVDALKASGAYVEADHIRENAALELHYARQIAQARRRDLDEWSRSFEKKLEDLKYRQLEAIKSGKFGQAASATAKGAVLGSSTLQNTEAGQVVQGFMNGGPLGALMAAFNALIGAVINAVAALENGQKILNLFSTIISKMFEVIGSLFDDSLKPAVDLLESIGTLLGNIIRPFAAIAALIVQAEPVMQIVIGIVEAVSAVFEALYEAVKPVLNAFITLYNGLADLLARIGINMRKITVNLDRTSKELEKFSKEQEERIRKYYQRREDAIKQLLNSQLEALKSQYELGLISREEYENQAEKYAKTADDQIISLNQQMLDELEKIKDNTHAALSEAGKQAAGKGRELAWWEKGLNLLTGGLYGIGKGIFGHASGSPNIEFDHAAIVHKGETIVPKTFAEGIRSGELALVGRGSSRAESHSPIYVSVSVSGSVVTEKELVDSVYQGIARGIESKRFSPLTGAA